MRDTDIVMPRHATPSNMSADQKKGGPHHNIRGATQTSRMGGTQCEFGKSKRRVPHGGRWPSLPGTIQMLHVRRVNGAANASAHTISSGG